ncbi:MAG: S9 family peptidase [Polyangiaceae bacterium]|nr:S9 family peptidase [Polyangiaceae bacterium]
MRVAPYGTWESPITPDAMTRGSVRFASPEVHADGELSWIEGRPAEGGRSVVVRRARGGRPIDRMPAPFNARSRVHEYGGRPHVFVGRDCYFVDFIDQSLRRARGADIERVTDGSFRLVELVADERRGRILAVGERAREDGAQPENGIVEVDLGDGAIRWLARGHDFYSAPALSPDGSTLAFLAWDHPHMPWDAAALYAATFEEDGTLGVPRRLAGGPGGSVFQPSFHDTGVLYACIEVRDRWRLHRFAGDEPFLVCDLGDADIGAPVWSLGTRLYGFASNGRAVAVADRNGTSSVVVIELASGRWETVVDDGELIGELSCREDDVLVNVGWASVGSRLVHFDLRTRASEVVRDALDGVIELRDVSKPNPITFPTSDGEVAHGFYYEPTNHEFRGPADAKPPLVVVAHGGPTGCANPAPQLPMQFWTTRGFAVLDVNYRGSTTFGRRYREKLRALWGIVDVSDCADGARHLVRSGRVDPARTIVRGQSAGGFTVLTLLTDEDVFRAGACLYGPSDPRAMVHETHKFESHYDRFLFGTGDDYERALDERAPLKKAERIAAPVIFFQGLEDKAVPAAQTERMFRALRERGIETEYHGYEGEQHGFRRAETIRDVWEKELAFYRRVLAIG